MRFAQNTYLHIAIKPSTQYTLHIQFAIYSKLLKHVEGLALNTSMWHTLTHVDCEGLFIADHSFDFLYFFASLPLSTKVTSTYKTDHSQTRRPGWMKRLRLFSDPKKGPLVRKQDRKLASRRQRGDINGDWRGTSTPTALKIGGRRFKMLQATKAGAPPSCVTPHCRMSRTHFTLALISSTNTQLWSLPHPAVSHHSRCEKNPAESEYKYHCWSR